MKRALTVVLLLMIVALLLTSLASITLADGSGLPPTTKKPPATSTFQLADGSGLPPGTTTPPVKPLGNAAA